MSDEDPNKETGTEETGTEETGTEETGTEETGTEETGTEETGTEEEESKEPTLDEIKEAISQGKPAPDGSNATLVELAEAQIKLDVSDQENAVLRESLAQDPSKLLTAEQLAEIEEVNSTKGFAEAKKLSDKYEKEALEKVTDNPEIRDKLKKVKTYQEYAQFLVKHKITDDQFQEAIGQKDSKLLEEGKITQNEFRDRTIKRFNALNNKNIGKVKDAPDIQKKGRSSPGVDVSKGANSGISAWLNAGKGDSGKK